MSRHSVPRTTKVAIYTAVGMLSGVVLALTMAS